MDITEVLQFVDRLVEKQTGEHLDDLQKDIIQGLWNGKSYNQMAKDISNGYSENYIGDVSRRLFRLLSKELDEEIKKSNFCWTIERVIDAPQFVGLVNKNITYCPYHGHADPKDAIAHPSPPEAAKPTTQYHDLTLAPKIRQFYDRTSELNTLSQWLFDRPTPLISVLGIGGIGKTALVKQFIDLNLEKFDIVVWKNLKLCPSLNTIIAEILTGIHPECDRTDPQLTELFNLFREQRCLIILDNLQEIFIPGQFAGQYQREQKDYKTLFTMLTEIDHQSSAIVISQEQCQETISLDEDLYPVKCLELQGLENPDLLKNLGLSDRQSWGKLMQRYEGHPVYLKEIASLIKNVFLGKVSEFLAEETLMLTEEMRDRFRELFQRLSPVEQQIILELSKSETPVSRQHLREALSLSSMDLINGLQSLQRRYLLKPIQSDTICFSLSPGFREYLLDRVL